MKPNKQPFQMKRISYTVCHSASGTWDVNEEACAEPVASFTTKEEAIERARQLAAGAPDAEVIVRE